MNRTESTSTVSTAKTGYLPTLDGWRALAVLSVIAFHDQVHRVGPVSDTWLHSLGHLGVDLFFAISGLLICSRLLDEEERAGKISLPAFYLRRTFRIIPPMLAYLLAIAVLGWQRIIHVGLGAWLASLVFVNNYYNSFRHDENWSLYTNHFWSLSVEEHFYLILPAVLVIFPKLRVQVLTLLTALFAFWRVVHAVLARHDQFRDFQASRSDLCLFGLLLPALLAVLLRKQDIKAHAVRYLHPWLIFPVISIVCLIGLSTTHALPLSLFVAISFPLMVLSTVYHPKSVVGVILEAPVLRAIGRVSYSIYLWQQLFFPGDHPKANGILAVLQHQPWNILCTLLLATASYWFIEKPFIRMGHRLAPPVDPGHRDLSASAPLIG